jgi:hypothetical protein
MMIQWFGLLADSCWTMDSRAGIVFLVEVLEQTVLGFLGCAITRASHFHVLEVQLTPCAELVLWNLWVVERAILPGDSW